MPLNTTSKKTTSKAPARRPANKPTTTKTTKSPAVKKSPAQMKTKKEERAKAVVTPPKEEKKAEPVEETLKVAAKRKVIHYKQMTRVLIEDHDNDIRSHGKAVLVVDNENSIAARYITYSGANILEASDPRHMEPERIRLGVMGAVRFGKPIVLDFGDCGPDMLDALQVKFDDVQKGLLSKCMNREVCKQEVYESLLKETDQQSFQITNEFIFEDLAAKFIFMVIVKSAVYTPSFTQKFYTVTIEQQ